MFESPHLFPSYKVHRFKGKTRPFTVYVLRGKSTVWKIIKNLIESYGYKVVVIRGENDDPLVHSELKEMIYWECDCAVAILTADEKLQNGNYITDPDVYYELGFVQALIDAEYCNQLFKDPVILLKQEKVMLPNSLSDLPYLDFNKNNIRELDESLHYNLDLIYNKILTFYQ